MPPMGNAYSEPTGSPVKSTVIIYLTKLIGFVTLRGYDASLFEKDSLPAWRGLVARLGGLEPIGSAGFPRLLVRQAYLETPGS